MTLETSTWKWQNASVGSLTGTKRPMILVTISESYQMEKPCVTIKLYSDMDSIVGS